ncbi:MAG: hypothetical protein DRP59_01150 [Spirochaetes bacterium]|nr:MAG: hypothetical protein DRP59_01150 [Spirochaetota bacterium]
MDYEKRLYMILYPNEALVASQLSPEMFARHYTAGSSRHYSGKVIFAELDSTFRNDYFKIDEIMKVVVPHEDGTPKATKFISSYRVLEHVDFSALRMLYITSQEGYCLGLAPGACDDDMKDHVALYAEISPMRMLVLSEMNKKDFGNYITDPQNNKSAPKQFFTQLDIDVVDFVNKFEQNPFEPSPIPELHPSTIRDGFYELKKYPAKHNKGLSLSSSLDNFSYKLIRNGFAFAGGGECLHYQFPDYKTIEKDHYKFWRTM